MTKVSVVFGASGFELVVEGTGARRGVECAEGLGHEGVDQPVIVHISALTTFFLPEARVIGLVPA